MKSVELNLNKRLLIVEYESEEELKIEWALMTMFKNPNITNHGYKVKPICKGSVLTEDIAKGLVELHENGYYKDYKNDSHFFTLPSKSFISAIEFKNYHWGENPVKLIERGEASEHERVKNQNDWQEAESRTFNPSKCIICEIV
ncbi:uncharacterized protein CHSO_1080 [Chryseobacterium sp. StRB126]|uniref:hypothetical protein n=1 Tax=Chryseobacterium sp. StRB126 TaxID=878220 RepID=UPI0004E98B2D|nr:hypothetical protein [Chryseobacterium sp. StRB126]BAP30117.1 uncharacterized protein CHSO_1080 [Chryseobacterium sp. StRB126]